MGNIVLSLEIFIFVFCLLNIIKNVYKVVKVFNTKEGKAEFSNLSLILFGMSISYVLTAIIMGFNMI